MEANMMYRELSGYECLETLRRAGHRGTRSKQHQLWTMLWGNILSFLGVRR